MGKKLSEREEEWQRQATAAAISAVRKVTSGNDAVVNENIPVGRLTDSQIGWIAAAAISAWIVKRAEQATAEGLDTERVIRATGYDPDPWDVGAIAAILPKLAETHHDWLKPFVQWSHEEMAALLADALKLVRVGIIARDLGGGSITRKSDADDLDDSVPML
jgi:hypothetical protein